MEAVVTDTDNSSIDCRPITSPIIPNKLPLSSTISSPSQTWAYQHPLTCTISIHTTLTPILTINSSPTLTTPFLTPMLTPTPTI